MKALILLRNKNLLTPTALLELFFELLRCQDKALRDFLQSHIVSDIKNVNAKRKNMKLNSVRAAVSIGCVITLLRNNMPFFMLPE